MRAIALSDEQAAAIEEVGQELLHAGDHRATALLSVVLTFRAAMPLDFHCNVDESAGMAEVVALDDYSKKT